MMFFISSPTLQVSEGHGMVNTYRLISYKNDSITSKVIFVWLFGFVSCEYMLRNQNCEFLKWLS